MSRLIDLEELQNRIEETGKAIDTLRELHEFTLELRKSKNNAVSINSLKPDGSYITAGIVPEVFHQTSELKPLICPRCGGSIDRATLKCKYCETEFVFSNGDDIYGHSKNIWSRDANGFLHRRDYAK